MAVTADEVMGRSSVCMPWVMKEILLNKSYVGGPLFPRSSVLAVVSFHLSGRILHNDVTSSTPLKFPYLLFWKISPLFLNRREYPMLAYLPPQSRPPSPTLRRFDHQKLIRDFEPLSRASIFSQRIIPQQFIPRRWRLGRAGRHSCQRAHPRLWNVSRDSCLVARRKRPRSRLQRRPIH